MSGDGWRLLTAFGTLVAAYYPVPLNAAVTPATIGFGYGRADTRPGLVVYVS